MSKEGRLCPSNSASLPTVGGAGRSAICRGVRLADSGGDADRTHRGFAAAALPVRPIRRQTPRGLVRFSIRLHHAPARGGRPDPRVAGLDHPEGRSFRRPRHPNRAGPLLPSTKSGSASAGTETSRTSTGCSACRWAPRASSDFGGPPTRSGSDLRSRPGRVRYTCCRGRRGRSGNTASLPSRRSATRSPSVRWPRNPDGAP
jgi:hypothetical protein